MFSYRLILGCIGIVLAYYYGLYVSDHRDITEQEKGRIIEAWQQMISIPRSSFSRISIGTNVNVDLIVRGTSLLRSLRVTPGFAENKEILQDVEDLQSAFHYYFKKGAGAERAFTNAEDFEKVIETAATLNEAQWYIGGNAALMAQNIASRFPDTSIQLVGPIGPKLAQLLDPNIKVDKASLVDKDEVHLIMEYGVGESWGKSSATVATRFITSHDIANGEMRPLESFFKIMDDPHLIILSGLHILEGQSDDFFIKKLGQLVVLLQKVPRIIPIHLELASMAKGFFVQALVTQIFPLIDSIGLNEQELFFISHVLGGPHANLVKSQKQPEIHQVSDILKWLMSTYGVGSRLTRIHFHSLTFHIISSIHGSPWSNLPVAVAAGTQVAGLQACDSDTFHLNDVDLLIPREFKLHTGAPQFHFTPSKPVTEFSQGNVDFCFSPVLVCRQPLKTVGLGDAISATGLIHSSFSFPSR